MNVVFFFTLVNLLIFHGNSEVTYEEGYLVTTVFDGNKQKINPHSVAPLSNSHDILLLDSTNRLFYTLSLPLSQESVVKKFSGNGKPQYSDGDSNSAAFGKPKSFTVDLKGNVYVADRINHAIRKISTSGVTTIAGGQKTGRDDGPGRNATFSTNYEISFVPDICALLIADNGNQLIRQINLKQEDCVSSQTGGLSSKLLVAGIAVSCLIVGLITGFAMRPYITRTEELKLLIKSWTSCLMNLERQARMHCFSTRNAVASPALQFLREIIILCFTHFSLMFSFLWINRVDSCSSSVCKEYISLLDSDDSSNSEHVILSQKYAEQMKELTTSNGDLGLSDVSNAILKHEDFLERDGQCHGQIDNLILANMQSFHANAGKSTGLEETFLGVSTVVKRR